MVRLRFNLIGSLLIVVQLVALAAVVLGAVARFVPGWRPGLLLFACTLVALEATYMQYVMRRERMWLSEGARYLVVEVAALLILMRAVSLATFSTGELWSWAQVLLRDPLAFFDYTYLGYIFAGLLTGVVGHAFAADLDAVAPREFDSPIVDSDANRRLLAQIGSDRLEALQRLSGRFVGGGMVVLVGLAAQSINIERVGGPGLPLSPWAGLAATCYFACGFLLYSQARLALLQSRWRLEGMAVAPRVARRWTGASLLLIVGVIGGALLLPRAYGLGLFDALGVVLQGLSYLVVLIGYLVVGLVSLLALIPVLLIAWLTGGAVAPAVPPPPPPPPPPVELIERTPPLLPALIFWACMLFLTMYALGLFVQRHPGLLRIMASNRLLRRLRALLRAIWSEAATFGELVTRQLRTRLSPRPQRFRHRPARLRLHGLSPREAVRRLYRSLLGQARKQGMPRDGGQTPYEYSGTLAQRVPEAAPDIAALTDAFVAAEYSRLTIDEADLHAARGPWKRLLRLLRRRT